ncbi:hypothetical protein JW998_01850 [candidate division KSB1 bacterium]|nr:hypothetical protein [candidate division KSB1 bacterium]
MDEKIRSNPFDPRSIVLVLVHDRPGYPSWADNERDIYPTRTNVRCIARPAHPLRGMDMPNDRDNAVK